MRKRGRKLVLTCMCFVFFLFLYTNIRDSLPGKELPPLPDSAFSNHATMIAVANVQSFAPETVNRLSSEYQAAFFDGLASSYALPALRAIGVEWVVLMFYPEEHESDRDLLLTMEKGTGKEKLIQLISLIVGEDEGLLDLKKIGPWWTSLRTSDPLDPPSRMRKNRWKRILKLMPDGSIYATVFPDAYAKTKVAELSDDQGSRLWTHARPFLDEMHRSEFYSLSFQLNPELQGRLRIKMNDRTRRSRLNKHWQTLKRKVGKKMNHDPKKPSKSDQISSNVLGFLVRGMDLRVHENEAIMDWSKYRLGTIFNHRSKSNRSSTSGQNSPDKPHDDLQAK